MIPLYLLFSYIAAFAFFLYCFILDEQQMTNFVPDERFGYLFTKVYERKQHYFELGYGLAMELNQISSYLTRSNVECSLLCLRINNCTGFDYVYVNSTCGIWESFAVVLPQNWSSPGTGIGGEGHIQFAWMSHRYTYIHLPKCLF